MDKITNFLNDLENIDPIKYTIVKTVYDIFHKTAPKLIEKFIYGGIGYFLNEIQIGGIYVSHNHVSITFSDGKSFDDPGCLLLGSGKYRGYLKIKNVSELNEQAIKAFIDQAIKIAEK